MHCGWAEPGDHDIGKGKIDSQLAHLVASSTSNYRRYGVDNLQMYHVASFKHVSQKLLDFAYLCRLTLEPIRRYDEAKEHDL